MSNIDPLHSKNSTEKISADDLLDKISITDIVEKICPKPFKSPTIAVLAQCLVPGLGHLYLKDYKTAASLFCTSAIELGGLHNKHTAYVSETTLVSTVFYGVYAAYRDARLYNYNMGYAYKMPTDTLKDLCFAPFNPKILKKKEVWGGLIADLGLAVGIGYLCDELGLHIEKKVSVRDLQPIEAFNVGIGEEALFRGFLQSALIEACRPTAGIVLSSLLFGAAHMTNAIDMNHHERKSYYAISVPYITLGGAYYGWVAYKNNSIKETVALHSWYDFVLFTLDRIIERSLKKSVFDQRSFSFSFTF